MLRSRIVVLAVAVKPASELFKALQGAQVVQITGSKSAATLVKLPYGVAWPQLAAQAELPAAANPPPLFVRSFYNDCFEGPLASLDPACTNLYRKFVIIGNAGSEWRHSFGGSDPTAVDRDLRCDVPCRACPPCY